MHLSTLLEPAIHCRTPFFIPFIGRSGSTHLKHLLNQHPQISCFGEMLNPRFIVRPKGFRHQVKRAIGRKLVLSYALRRVYGRNGNKLDAQGFKLKVDNGKDLDHFPEVMEFFDRHRDRIKCIYLHRENSLRGAISEQNFKRVRKKFRSANMPANQSSEVLGKLVLDVERVIQRTRERELEHEKILAKTRDRFEFINVTYENLIANQTQSLDKIAAFLGVAPFSQFSVVAKTSKISGDRLEDYIENVDELKSALISEGMRSAVQMNFGDCDLPPSIGPV